MITLPVPPPINQTYKTTRMGGFYKSAEAKAWEEGAYWHIKTQRNCPKGLKKDIVVTLSFFFKRNRDIDGCIKIVLDILQKAGVVENDMGITTLVVYKSIDKECPRVEIEVR